MDKDILKQIKKLLFTEDETKTSTTPETQETKKIELASEAKVGDALMLGDGAYKITVAANAITEIVPLDENGKAKSKDDTEAGSTGGLVPEETGEDDPETPPGFSAQEFSKQLTELKEKFSSIESKVEEFGKQSGADPLKIQDTSDSKSEIDLTKIRKYFKSEKDFKTAIQLSGLK